MRILGLMGQAGVGKDSVAEILGRRYRVMRFAFADQLRIECAAAWGVDIEVFLRRELRNEPQPALALDRCMSAPFRAYAWELGLLGPLRPRSVMQRWGDYRRSADPDHYVHALAPAIDQAWAAAADALVVTDVRFPNELVHLRGLGAAIWRVHRPGLGHPEPHASERVLSGVAGDLTIVNDGRLIDLETVVLDVAAGLLGDAR